MLEHPSFAHLLEDTLPVCVRGVLNGRPIGPLEARALQCLLVTSEHYWLCLQELYDEDVARLANAPPPVLPLLTDDGN